MFGPFTSLLAFIGVCFLLYHFIKWWDKEDRKKRILMKAREQMKGQPEEIQAEILRIAEEQIANLDKKEEVIYYGVEEMNKNRQSKKEDN